MKIGVLADTHDRLDITREAIGILKARGATALFHCGDLMSEAMLALFEGCPTTMVFGNNDKDRVRFAKLAKASGIDHLGDGGERNLGAFRIAITHGDQKGLVQKLMKTRPDLLLLGHSHRQRDEVKDGVWIINPGALHRATVKTCALLDLTERRAEFIPVP